MNVQRMRARTALTAVAALFLGLLGVGIASADFVSHNIVNLEDPNTIEMEVGDTATVTLSWNVEGTGSSSTLIVVNEGEDDEYSYWDTKSGCNIAAGKDAIGEADDPQVTLVSTTSPTGIASVTNAVFDDCKDEIDDEEVPQTRTVTVTGLAAGTTVVTFAIDDDESKYHVGIDLVRAEFTVVVIDPVGSSMDAPAIANQFLLARGDGKKQGNEDCKENLGTTKNKANWHGNLISSVAKKYEGETFTQAQVEAYVENACQTGNL